MLDPQETTVSTRHLTPDEIDEIARRARLSPRRRADLATTPVPADIPSHQAVESMADLERLATALATWLGRPHKGH